MTTRQFIEVEEQLLAHLPGFRIKGKLMIQPPVDQLLHAISFERSINKGSFYVWRFVMPLCVPYHLVYYDFGKRVRDSLNREGWSHASPNLIEELASCLKADALPFFSKVETLLDFVELARPR